MLRSWKLGEDMNEDDSILDPICFYDIILSLHCGSKVINEAEAMRIFVETLNSRLEDAQFVLNNNMDEILRRAKVGRADYEKENQEGDE